MTISMSLTDSYRQALLSLKVMVNVETLVRDQVKAKFKIKVRVKVKSHIKIRPVNIVKSQIKVNGNV